jgi:hypothetical protein
MSPDVNHYYSPDPQESGIGYISQFHSFWYLLTKLALISDQVSEAPQNILQLEVTSMYRY